MPYAYYHIARNLMEVKFDKLIGDDARDPANTNIATQFPVYYNYIRFPSSLWVLIL